MALNIDDFIEEFIQSQKASGVSFPTFDIYDPETGAVIDNVDTEALTRAQLIPFITELFNHSTRQVITTAADLVLTDSENQSVLVDSTGGNVTVTLPSPLSTDGKTIIVKKADASSNRVRVLGAVDGGASFDLFEEYESQSFLSDGAKYWTTDSPRIVQRGSKAFVVSASEAVVFPNAMPSADYLVNVNPTGNPGGGVWITAKTAAGFTINFSVNVTLTALWDARI